MARRRKRAQTELFPRKRKPPKGGPAQPKGKRQLAAERAAAEQARARRHGLLGDPLPEEELAELAEGTLEDVMAAERIRRLIAEDVRRIRAKPAKKRSDEESEYLAWLEGLTDAEIERAARVRCDFCGADPRDPQLGAAFDVYGGRQLSYAGCCAPGSEEVHRWLAEATTEERLRWAQAVFGPWLENYGQLAYVTGPTGQVEKRRRGQWVPTEETAPPFMASFGLQAYVVRDARSLERVNAFVARYHVHMPWGAGTTWKFGVMVYNGPDLIGVAYVQQPGARSFPQDGSWLDVARVAIRRDMPPFLRSNAASLIYATAWRAARSGEWVSDEEWARIKATSDRRRERAEKKDRATVAQLEKKPALSKSERSELRRAEARLRDPWRAQRRAVRMITYTLADEELGTTLKASGWEPAAWSPPHAKPTGARAARGEKAGQKPKIRWQVGLREHRRRIVRLLGKVDRARAQADVVEVAPSPRGPGGVAHTLLPRVYGVSNMDLQRQPFFTWEETLAEAEARPPGIRRKLNPKNPNLRAKVRPCGARPKAIEWHLVEKRGQGALLALDAHNVRHFGPELFWENRCPLLAGFREGKKEVAREGVTFERAPITAKSRDLARLAARVGIPLSEAERLLVQEGRAWWKHTRQKKNPPRGREDWYFESTPALLAAVRESEPDFGFAEEKAVFVEPGTPVVTGRSVDWLMTTPYVVEAPVDKIMFMEGNLWNLAHARALLELIRHGEPNPVFDMPAARLYRIDADDLEYTRAEAEAGELDYQYGMQRPWEPADVSTFHVQLLDGNHRALAAIAAGEETVPVVVGPSYRADVRPGEWAEPDEDGWGYNPRRVVREGAP